MPQNATWSHAHSVAKLSTINANAMQADRQHTVQQPSRPPALR